MGTQFRDHDNQVQRIVRGTAQSHAGGAAASSWPAWLGEESADARHLKALHGPIPANEMTCWPVSPRVGNVKNNDPALIEPITLAAASQWI